METRRWVNPSQPQTLYMATVLSYINAGFALVLGGDTLFRWGPAWGILLLGAQVVGAYGIANEWRWAYLLAVVVATLALVPFAELAISEGIGALVAPLTLLSMLFPVALFALLVHPQSREYQKVWFS